MAPQLHPLVLTVLWAVAAATAAAPNSPPAVVTSAAYLSSESEIIDTAGWMRTLYGVQFDEDERRCAKEDKVLFRPLKQCFFLFRRGPCQKYEWLVFDKEKAAASGALEAACKRRMCAPNWGHDAAKNTCFEQSKCASPTAFHYSLFGDGVCRCNGTTGRLATAPPDASPACYELYHHRPCDKGWMLAPRYRLLQGMDAMCFRDPCADYKPPAGNASASAPAPTPAPSKPDATTRAPGARGAPEDAGRAPPQAQAGRPDGRGGFRVEASGPAFPLGRDVEDVTRPNAPNLGVKTSTRGVIASGAGSRNVEVHGHWSGFNQHGHDHFHEHTHNPVRNIGRDGVQDVRGLPGFKISLKPIRLVLVPGGRVRRDVIFPDRAPRHARGETALRAEGSREGRGGAAGGDSGTPQGNVLAPAPASGVGVRAPAAAGAGNDVDDYTLEVQYANGERSCMTSKQLNVICDLMMVPLFSDLSELKVPICVNTLFRFALGRVGKSDECAENDAGKCAQKVVVKSPDPLDWELE